MDDTYSFGGWVQRRRRMRDLTQADLAVQVGCSRATIRAIEGDARRPSRQIAEHLADALGLPPALRSLFVEVARGSAAVPTLTAALATPEAPRGAVTPPGAPPGLRLTPPSLPPTRLIGRETVVAHGIDRLSHPEVRLVTLTGPGGVGKSRLAVELAHALRPAFGDGVAFVALAPIAAPEHVVAALARAVAVRERGGVTLGQQLLSVLAQRELLLVLDNMEHVLAAAPFVAELLAACPRLKVLATSRAPLRLRAEHTLTVPPLPLSRRAAGSATEALAMSPAVELFVERARAHGTQLSRAEDLEASATICRLLDGLPLAIELAAARSALLSPRELLARLQAAEPGVTLELLRGGPRDLPVRQQTLRATIAWSYGLLSSAAQRLLAWLSVFAGGFTLAAAEAVFSDGRASATPTVMDLLADLVDQSLVQRSAGAAGETRFTLLETVRAFAGEVLDERAEGAIARRRHAIYMLGLARTLAPASSYAFAPEGPPLLERELDNLRAALDWCLKGGDAQLGITLAVQLIWFWDVRRHWSEGYGYLMAFSKVCGPPGHSGPETDALLMQARQGAAWLAHRFGDLQTAQEYARATIATAERLGDQAMLGRSLSDLAWFTVLEHGDLAAAVVHLERSLAIFRALEDLVAVAQVLIRWSDLANSTGDYSQGLALSQASVATARTIGDPELLTSALDQLALAHLWRGEDAQALAASDEGMAILSQLAGGTALPAYSYVHAQVALRQGNYAVAAGRTEAILAFWRDQGDALMQGYALDDLARIVVKLGDYGRARALYGESIKWLMTVGEPVGVLYRLQGLAALDCAQGESWRAARLCGALAELLAQARHELVTPYKHEHEQSLASLRERLGAEALEAFMASGRQLTLEQAVREALGTGDVQRAPQDDGGDQRRSQPAKEGL